MIHQLEFRWRQLYFSSARHLLHFVPAIPWLVPHVYGCHAKFCCDSSHLYHVLQIANGPDLFIYNSLLRGSLVKQAADRDVASM